MRLSSVAALQSDREQKKKKIQYQPSSLLGQSDFSPCSVAGGGGTPLCIGKQEVGTYIYSLVSEVGTRNFFLSPQSQFRNLKEALPQSQFHNFWRNVAPQPQLRNSAIAIFSEIRNFKSATWELQFRNFRHIFGRGIWSIHGEKIRGKKSRATFFLDF